MTVTAQMVKELREKTQAGMMDCRKALVDSEGDMEKASELLRKKGLAQAAKRAGRDAKEGVIDAYVHSNGKLAVLLELNCETDFVARTDEFRELAHDLAMQVAATSPQYVSIEEVPEDVLEQEKSIYRDQLKDSGKPENVIEKIIEGKLKKFYEENVLLEQKFVKDESVTIKDLIVQAAAKLGENVILRRFARMAIGE